MQTESPKFALAIIEMKDVSFEAMQVFCKTLSKLENIQPQDLKVLKLSAGVFFFPLNGGLTFFSNIVSHATDNELHLRVLLFDQEPSWITS